MICPRCAIEMEHLSRHGVTVDRCEVCGGVWLDKGELETIVETVRAPVVLGAPAQPQRPMRKPAAQPRDPQGTPPRDEFAPPRPDPRNDRRERYHDDDDWDDRYYGKKTSKYRKKHKRPTSTKARLMYILKEILD